MDHTGCKAWRILGADYVIVLFYLFPGLCAGHSQQGIGIQPGSFVGSICIYGTIPGADGGCCISYRPAFIFGGYTWPMEAMDPVTQMIASLFPMAWLSNAVRELFLSGHFALLQRNVCALLILGTIFLVIGSLLFCRRMKNGAR